MTPQSFPLKMLGQPWPGINTRGGILDMGNGQLTDRSTNVIINTMDTLEKRRGFVRGLDERFSGAVCGLHKYTDQRGIEWLIVVDEEGFHIRQPFDIPVFEIDDRYPNDGFSGTNDRVNLNSWSDVALAYELDSGRLRLRNGLTNTDRSIRWFKETPLDLFIEYQLTFQDEDASTNSCVVEALRQNDDLTGGGLEIKMERSAGTMTFTTTFIDASGTRLTLFTDAVSGTSFVVRASYRSATRTVDVNVFPAIGSSVLESVRLTELQAEDLGGWFGLRIESDTAGISSGFEQIFSTRP